MFVGHTKYFSFSTAGHTGSASSSASLVPVTPTPSVASTTIASTSVSPHQKSLAADGSPVVGSHAWGPPRIVELLRQEGKSLGISIVGK